MRIYISADLEGVTGVSKWDETIKGKQDYETYRLQMTKEVVAACEGAIEEGVDYIIVKDAHDDGKNLIQEMLPSCVKVISGWSNHPYNMVEGIDDGFDAAIFIGYHSGAGSNGSPLSHTLYPDKIKNIIINGEEANEFLIHAYTCYTLNVPVIAVSGDGELMRYIRKFNPSIKTMAVQEGFGGATVSVHPNIAAARIKEGVKMGIESLDNEECAIVDLPSEYEMIIEFRNHVDAYKFSFYPEVEQIGEYSIRYKTSDYMKLLSLLLFVA